MLIYFFQDSLTKSALNWYMILDSTKINKLKDLVDVLLKQYKFNLKIASNRTILMAIKKGNHESVRIYMQRWRDKVTHVQPSLIETEMVMLFSNTFQSLYYKHVMGSSA
jgi:hypothetical protein